MVGDGEADLHAGRAAGLRTIACLYGYGREPQLRELGADYRNTPPIAFVQR